MVTATPNILTPAYISERWPRLYHMAEAGSWPSIKERGLLSTTALLDLFELEGESRDGSSRTASRIDPDRAP